MVIGSSKPRSTYWVASLVSCHLGPLTHNATELFRSSWRIQRAYILWLETVGSYKIGTQLCILRPATIVMVAFLHARLPQMLFSLLIASGAISCTSITVSLLIWWRHRALSGYQFACLASNSALTASGLASNEALKASAGPLSDVRNQVLYSWWCALLWCVCVYSSLQVRSQCPYSSSNTNGVERLSSRMLSSNNAHDGYSGHHTFWIVR